MKFYPACKALISQSDNIISGNTDEDRKVESKCHETAGVSKTENECLNGAIAKVDKNIEEDNKVDVDSSGGNSSDKLDLIHTPEKHTQSKNCSISSSESSSHTEESSEEQFPGERAKRRILEVACYCSILSHL